MNQRRALRRTVPGAVAGVLVAGLLGCAPGLADPAAGPSAAPPAVVHSTRPPADPRSAAPQSTAPPSSRHLLLGGLTVKGRGPKTGYHRDRFGPAWSDVDRNGCDTRNDILSRDLTGVAFRPGTSSCVVISGRLADPYTGRQITFTKANASAVHVDHVVALSDAWQKGAQYWPPAQRVAFGNDPLNLLAVSGSSNASKGDSDAASWLPPNNGFRCAFVGRQMAVKAKYRIWVTAAERDAMARVLRSCPNPGR